MKMHRSERKARHDANRKGALRLLGELRPRSAGISVVLALFLPSVVSSQITADPPVPQISEIEGSTEVTEGEGLAFAVLVFNPGGQGLNFEWDLGDGMAGVGGPDWRAVTHRYRQNGEYTVTVTASGSSGFAATRRLDVVVGNAAPTIHGLSHDEPIRPRQTAEFRGDATDPGDEELTYIWDFGDGSPPRSGVDLRVVDHAYAEAGEYRVTLTVVDDEGLEAVRTILVRVNPGLLARMGGGGLSIDFAGESGTGAMVNALPGGRWNFAGPVPHFTGGAPVAGGIADVSEALGICLVNAGFWDDENKAHVNFQLQVPSESAFDPRTFTVDLSQPQPGLGDGRAVVSALVLGIDAFYQDTKGGAGSVQEFSTGDGALRTLIGRAARLFGRSPGGPPGGMPGGMPSGSGTNWQLAGTGGTLRFTRVTYERIYGDLQVSLFGGRMSATGAEQVEGVSLEGGFVWELDEPSRLELGRCGKRPFGIESHTPRTEELHVSFTSPSVTITFTHELRAESVNAQTVQVGYLDRGAQFVALEGTLLPDRDGRTVRFTPAVDLLDAVYYYVRVRGGESGVRSSTNEELEEDYEWRFATVVDLLPPR